ncbi:Amino acid transporter domain containing protein [Trichostrongylus colubriformis]|uniref:Amino acid transporter domain containing protein n=1 Tax=Trichostrongylus colubriformis TaxID=6319 RepID=A0AAN8GCR7_TRICO
MAVTTYTAYALGECWNILRSTWPMYRVHCRKPYASIGYRAMGIKMRKFVSIIIDVTQFGVSTVFLLLSAKNIHFMLKAFTNTDFSYCYVVLIVAVCLLPVTFLKSPQDFWIVVMVAMGTVVAAVMLIVAGIGIDYELCSRYTEVPELIPKNFFLSLGTLMFACGGHAAFPTVQHDMKDSREYPKSVIAAYTSELILFTL